MKVLSFLGYGSKGSQTLSGYHPATYRLGDIEVTTEYFPIVMLEVFGSDLDELVLFVTEEVCRDRLGPFLQAVPDTFRSRIRSVDIQRGSSPEELWNIFNTVVSQINSGDSLVIDITHGFRSIPMLALVALQFLKVTANVQVQGIYYGAFESSHDGHTPVFDLSPFISLMDWSYALTLFNEAGNAVEIARILKEEQARLHCGGTTGRAPTRLAGFGSALKEIGDNLLLMKTRSAARSIAALPDQLARAEKEINQHTPPLAAVLQRTCDSLVHMGCPDVGTLNMNMIRIQHEQVAWYREHGHLVHAVGLLRELLVNMACFRLKVAEPFDYNQRKPIDALLGYLAAKPDNRDATMQDKMSEETAQRVREFSSSILHGHDVMWWEAVGKLFAETRELRNALLHAEMSRTVIKTGTISNKIENIAIRTGQLIDELCT